jgi:citrate lyase subunit beta/citryl-CoA lyase
MVETACGVLNAHEMACSTAEHGGCRVQALCLGGEDLAWDLGAVRTKGNAEIAHARNHLVLAAGAAGIMAIDTIYTDFGDAEGFSAEACQARRLGYSGKLLIHPGQIELAHRAFAPSEEELAHARRVLEAFEAAGACGEGVIALDGQMIDAPVVARARKLLALARSD